MVNEMWKNFLSWVSMHLEVKICWSSYDYKCGFHQENEGDEVPAERLNASKFFFETFYAFFCLHSSLLNTFNIPEQNFHVRWHLKSEDKVYLFTVTNMISNKALLMYPKHLVIKNFPSPTKKTEDRSSCRHNA